MKSKKTAIFILFIILTSFISGFMFIKDHDLIADERVHYAQIRSFVNKDFALHPGLTTIPGYNFVLAMFGLLFNLSSPIFFRLINSIFSLFSILVFFLVAKKISADITLIKTLQYCFFPILFPFFFLLYTDVFSLLFILLSLYLLLKKEYDFAAITVILSFFVRQNNIIWLAFIAAFVYYEKYHFKFNIKILKEYIKTIWVFIAGLIVFLIFIILNKGFAVGDRTMHPAFSFQLGNIFFMLFVFFFLFLPLNISNFPKIIKFIKNHKKAVIISAAFIFLIYMFGFVNTHLYNQADRSFFLRNKLLVFITSTILIKSLAFIPIAYSILSIAVTKLHRKSFYLIYPFALLYLMPSWLIEQRYYLIPFALFILFRKKESRLIEYSLIILYIISSIILFYGIRNGMFFI